MFFHVFAQTTHVVAAPHGFACVGHTRDPVILPSFIEIRLGVSQPHGVKIWPFPLLWLVAFTTACTTVQAVTSRDNDDDDDDDDVNQAPATCTPAMRVDGSQTEVANCFSRHVTSHLARHENWSATRHAE